MSWREAALLLCYLLPFPWLESSFTRSAFKVAFSFNFWKRNSAPQTLWCVRKLLWHCTLGALAFTMLKTFHLQGLPSPVALQLLTLSFESLWGAVFPLFSCSFFRAAAFKALHLETVTLVWQCSCGGDASGVVRNRVGFVSRCFGSRGRRLLACL